MYEVTLLFIIPRNKELIWNGCGAPGISDGAVRCAASSRSGSGVSGQRSAIGYLSAARRLWSLLAAPAAELGQEPAAGGKIVF